MEVLTLQLEGPPAHRQGFLAGKDLCGQRSGRIRLDLQVRGRPGLGIDRRVWGDQAAGGPDMVLVEM